MFIWKPFYFMLALGTLACAVPRVDPVSPKPGTYCAAPASIQNDNDLIRANLTFCLQVHGNLQAQFLVGIANAEWRSKKGDDWSELDYYYPFKVDAVLYFPSGSKKYEEVKAVAPEIGTLRTIAGSYLPGTATPGSKTYRIHCMSSFPDVSKEDILDIDEQFTFNIDKRGEDD